MTMNFYTINARPYAFCGSITQELDMDPAKAYLFNLPHLGLIDVDGDRAFELLQGQLSCDIRAVTGQQAVRGAQCNLKGRVLALMDVLDWQGFKLIVPDDLLEPSLVSLFKPAQLARVHLQKNVQIQVHGLYAPNAQAPELKDLNLPSNKGEVRIQNDFLSYAMAPPFYLILEKNAALDFIKNSFQLKQALAWHYLQVKNGYMQIYPLSRGLFLPHRLCLHTTGCISFDKGCYKGQEIIARTHYRAKLKYDLHQVALEQADFISGQEIELENGRKGELIDFCPLSAQQILGLVSEVHKEG